MDPEKTNAPSQKKVPYFRRLFDQSGITQDVIAHQFAGEGTETAPFLVDFLPLDPWNPMTLPKRRKWTITAIQALNTLAVTFASSAPSGDFRHVVEEFNIGQELVILSTSTFVLGFALGPLIWAPISEVYGRQKLFFLSYLALTALSAGVAAAPSISALIVLRFFAGTFGSSPLTNAGGVIADMFSASERGLATSLFAMAPFLGPALGPIAGGFLGEYAGWRWVQGMVAIFTGVCWMLSSLTYVETYTPVILRRRAIGLANKTGRRYISRLDNKSSPKSLKNEFLVALGRPWVILFKEPIVLLVAIYMGIIYGTLYLCFAAFPIVFQQGRGWSPGVGGLSFIGITVGMLFAITGTIMDNKRYMRIVAASPSGLAPPEARLPPAIVGSILIPTGLFWFAWTNGDDVHWIVPILGSVVFAAGIVLVFLALMNYLIDSYVVYAASVLAASSVLRSAFGAAFPLFAAKMYENLGVHWASSVPAFLALACLPFPFLFWRYGVRIRMKCVFAAEAAELLQRMRMVQSRGQTPDEQSETVSRMPRPE